MAELSCGTEKCPGVQDLLFLQNSCEFLTLEAQISVNCVNDADNFCYISAEVTFASKKQTPTAMVRKAYQKLGPTLLL